MKDGGDFGRELLNLLYENEQKNDFKYITRDLLNASKPRITVKIDISEEIKNESSLIILDYCDKDDFNTIKIDFTIDKDIEYLKINNKSVEYVQKQLNKNYQIRSLMLVLKRYLKIRKMNEVYKGGISAISLLLMVLNAIKENPENNMKLSQLLKLFFEKFSKFRFEVSGIGTDNKTYVLPNLQWNNKNIIPYILNPLNGYITTKNGSCKGPDINAVFSIGYKLIDDLLNKFGKNNKNKDLLNSFFFVSKK